MLSARKSQGWTLVCRTAAQNGSFFFVAVSNGTLWGQAGELEKQCTC